MLDAADGGGFNDRKGATGNLIVHCHQYSGSIIRRGKSTEGHFPPSSSPEIATTPSTISRSVATAGAMTQESAVLPRSSR